MVKKLFLCLALAFGLYLAAPAGEAAAATAAPAATAVPAAAPSLLAPAAWACGPRRCVWTPGYRGVIPDYAVTWGPPLYTHCYWVRGPLGKWRYRC